MKTFLPQTNKLFARARVLFCLFTMVLSTLTTATNVMAYDASFKAQNDVLYSEEPCSAGSTSSNTTPQPTSTSAVGQGGWASPVEAGTPITSDYKSAERPGHRGVDLGAPDKSPIYASRDGTVVASGPAQGFGNWIVIQHEVNGQRVDTVYGHMRSEDLMVHTGDKVTAGQQISRVGSEGGSDGPHLHYEEWDGGRFAGTERKPEAVYGQTPGQPAAPQANPAPQQQVSNPSPAATASGCNASSPTAPVNCASANNTPDREKFVWDYLRGQGLSANQTAAVMGNLAHEGGDPTFKKATDAYEVGGANAGYGIAQWSFERQTQLRDAAQAAGKDVRDLCFQLDYLVQESKGRKQRGNSGASEWDGLLQQQSLHDAVYYFEYNYERPSPGSTANREKYAQQYLDKYGAGNV